MTAGAMMAKAQDITLKIHAEMSRSFKDGAALHRLREALPEDARLELWMMNYPSRPAWGITVILDDEDGVITFERATIAEAADKCREAL